MNALLESLRRRPVVLAFCGVTLLALAATAIARPGFRARSKRPGPNAFEDRAAVDGFLFGPRPPETDPLFARLDTDGDGHLAPWEIEWATESLRSMDANRDGWVGPADLRHAAPRHHPPHPPHFPPPPPFAPFPPHR